MQLRCEIMSRTDKHDEKSASVYFEKMFEISETIIHLLIIDIMRGGSMWKETTVTLKLIGAFQCSQCFESI